MFPDSQIAKQYKCAKTKRFCILNRALTQSFQIDLVSKMKANPYTLTTDGSNDSDLTKLNPLTIKIFDISFNKITSNLLDMCTTKGATAAYNFE
jgi:hypothetical protein